MANFKSLAKRKREQAKLTKRQAKDQKRALRKAERSGSDPGAQVPATPPALQSMPTGNRPATGTAPARKPMTLAEAVERWKATKVVQPKRR